MMSLPTTRCKDPAAVGDEFDIAVEEIRRKAVRIYELVRETQRRSRRLASPWLNDLLAAGEAAADLGRDAILMRLALQFEPDDDLVAVAHV
jgi:hypothetical protein